MDIEHRHIEVFRAVMQAGSVTAAAAQLFSSQPTVSRDLARLEYLLGFALFDRVRGRLKPTARALALYEEVQRSYVGLERILATASGLREFAAASLSIACVPAFAQSLLPAACRRFRAQHAEVALAITPAESPLLEEWLSAQRFDLGLTEQDAAPPGCSLTPLFAGDEVCVLPAQHPLATHTVLALEDFAGQPFISLAPSDPYRLQVDAAFQASGVSRQLTLETQSAASVCALVGEGLGVAIVNPLTALDAAARSAGQLAVRRLAVAIPFRVSLVQPQYRPGTPLTADFSTALHAEAASLAARLAAL